MTRLLPLAAAPALLIGCEAVSSQDIRTGAIYADIAVESEGEGTAQVHTTLRLGGATSNTFVDLEGGDRLTVATADGEPIELAETRLAAIHHYAAEVPLDAEGTAYTVALERDLDTPAPASVAVMPAPFDLIGPEDGLALSRETDDLTLTWTPDGAGDDVRIEAEGDCLALNQWDVAGDPGTHTIEAGTWEAWGDDLERSCAVTLTVRRQRAGSLDPALSEGGTVFAVQRRSVSVRLDP